MSREGTKLCKHCKTEIPVGAKMCPNCRKKQGGGIFKWIIIAIIVIGLISAVSGGGSDKDKVTDATKSKETSVKQDKDNPDEQTEDFKIDIEQCISDLRANLPLEPDYTFVHEYYIKAEGTDLTITAVVDDATDPNKALDFADTLVRQLNLYANIQDNNVELGNANFYGGLYKEYSALVGVSPASRIDNPDNWFVYDAISGGRVKLKLSKQYR